MLARRTKGPHLVVGWRPKGWANRTPSFVSRGPLTKWSSLLGRIFSQRHVAQAGCQEPCGRLGKWKNVSRPIVSTFKVFCLALLNKNVFQFGKQTPGGKLTGCTLLSRCDPAWYFCELTWPSGPVGPVFLFFGWVSFEINQQKRGLSPWPLGF